MEKIRKVVLIAVLLISLTGCFNTGTDTSTNANDSTSVTTQSKTTNTEPTTVPATPQAEEKMDERAVVKLATEANKRYWYVISFPVNGMDYRYMGSDLGTREKLLSYLLEVYTTEASEALIKELKIVEHEGRNSSLRFHMVKGRTLSFHHRLSK